MVLPDFLCCPLNIFFKGLRKEVCEACPFFKNSPKIMVIIAKNTCVPAFENGFFSKEKEYNPHIHIG
ncbi:hypothetical protein DW884_18045 [Ruminococcus sp. AM40-10AC]|nr:hypothetical protein DW884_18045 [Ruminococcus sp. AM40-10AC]